MGLKALVLQSMRADGDTFMINLMTNHQKSVGIPSQGGLLRRHGFCLVSSLFMTLVVVSFFPHSSLRMGLSAFAAMASKGPKLGTSENNSQRPPLGVSFDPEQDQFRFALKSTNATRIELLIFTQAMGEKARMTKVLERSVLDKETWSVSIPKSELLKAQIIAESKSGPAQRVAFFYGYRLWGPNWPYQSNWTPGTDIGFVSDVDGFGNRFNPNKLVFDPYALEISHDPRNKIHQTTYEFATGEKYRKVDSSVIATKGLYFENLVFSDDSSSRIQRGLKDEIIYEAHVRGLTMSHPQVPLEFRGTYRGAIYLIPYLKSLGVTAIEFLPVQETQNDQNDLDVHPSDYNYWGYMTLNYFAPDRRYSSDKSPGGPTREFMEMTKAFRSQGMKVYIDVVYNHTAEGGLWGNDPNMFELYSFRGIDSAAYYQRARDQIYYQDNTGIGHNLNTSHPMVSQLIVDSLRHWKSLGVDGFRFDLASVLGNTNHVGDSNFDPHNPSSAVNRIFREVPSREYEGKTEEGVDLISEPWAIGMYNVGGFPLGWAEWNGKFRDTMRKKMNKLGSEWVTPGELGKRIAGSSDLFEHNGRKPYHSINFMDAHDGFTMRDLFTYNEKQNNLEMPFGPSGGGENHNNSWDQGGRIEDQVKAVKNAMSLLLLSAGTPMFVAGDEQFRTQRGNNNTYNLDTKANWLQWEEYLNSRASQDVFSFTQKLIALRKAVGALSRGQFFPAGGAQRTNGKELTWLSNQSELQGREFDDGSRNVLGYRLNLHEQENSPWKTMIVYFNFDPKEQNIQLPLWSDSIFGSMTKSVEFSPERWTIYASTSIGAPQWPNVTGSFKMEGRSSIIFLERR